MSQTYTLIIKPDAAQDIREIKNWYNEQANGLGDKFIDALDDSLMRIAHYPKSFAKTYKGLRRVPLLKFPFQVFFIFDDSLKCVFVTGVFHTSRNPKIWKERT